MKNRRVAYRILVWRLDEKGLRGRPRLIGIIILKCIFKKWDGNAWSRLIWV
jgi:hypothetical protein